MGGTQTHGRTRMHKRCSARARRCILIWCLWKGEQEKASVTAGERAERQAGCLIVLGTRSFPM